MMLLSQVWVARLAWTLLHFLWQGTAIAALFALARAAFARSLSSRTRYALACATLAAMTAAPMMTYFAISSGETTPALAAARIPANVLPYVVIAWMAGVILFSIRLIGGWRFASRLRCVGVHVVPEEWRQTFEKLLSRMHVSRRASLLLSTIAETPMVVGWLRPVVLMPIRSLTGFPPEHVLALLAHEIAHIRRSDYLINILQSIAESVLFYHPAVWWVSREIRAEREACCDDLAVAVCGGDVGAYARALAGIEARRPSRLRLASAADGGSLVQRIGRLIGRQATISQMLPGPGAAVALLVLCIFGLTVVHGSAALQPVAQHSGTLLALPLQSARSALLFDPFFEPPPPQSPPAAPQEPSPEPSHPQHGHRIAALGAFLTDIKMPMTFADAVSIPSLVLFRDERFNPNLRLRTLTGVDGADIQLICPMDGAVFETWVENASAEYVESFRENSGDIERGTGWMTISRSIQDSIRHVSVKYKVNLERVRPVLPAAYSVTFGEYEEKDPQMQVSTDSNNIGAGKYPAPQAARNGDVIAVELYRDSSTGQRIVDYIHVGAFNKMTLRTEAPHDTYSDDAEFNLAKPKVRINGEVQESRNFANFLKGSNVWVYVPGYGRYVASFKRRPGLDIEGEVTGNTLTFTEGSNIIRIDCAERIAAGSGSYRVYLKRDSNWIPADLNDRGKAMIGTTPGRIL